MNPLDLPGDTMEPDLQPFCKKRWEVRPCGRCHHRRRVLVRTYPHRPGEETFAQYCEACDLVQRAEVHEEAAVKLRKRATQLFWKRRQRQKEKTA